jgi:hypothetical protein
MHPGNAPATEARTSSHPRVVKDFFIYLPFQSRHATISRLSGRYVVVKMLAD